jgi:DNA-binding response OmpR family regulator
LRLARFAMRVLVLDSDKTSSAVIRRALVSLGASVDCEANGQIGLEVARSEAYSLTVICHSLQDISCTDALIKLRRGGYKTPIMIIAKSGESLPRIEYLNLGADECLMKPLDPFEFEALVRVLVRRESGGCYLTLRCGPLAFDPMAFSATLRGVSLGLRRREAAVLAVLMSRPGKLVRKERLMWEIFGFDEPVAPNAIEVQVARLRKKIGCDGPAIKTVRGLGYLIEYDSPEQVARQS